MSPDPTESVLTALCHRQPIVMPVAVVVAHPDDETIGVGPLLRLFRHLLLIHVTDGAPRNLRDAHRSGFDSCAAYSTARRLELYAALGVAAVSLQPADHPIELSSSTWFDAPAGARTLMLNIPDQDVSFCLCDLAATLTTVLAGAAVVLTHAYEGGHPDHDAVAFAVQAAGRPRIEIALYHAAADGRLVTGDFLPGAFATTICLSPQEQAVRTAMLDRFTTQQTTLAAFRDFSELRFRAAPTYDFTRPPAERVYYDAFDWGMTKEHWCRLAAEALA